MRRARPSAATPILPAGSSSSPEQVSRQEQFETLVASILRNTSLRQPSVLPPKSLRRSLQIAEGITANIFHMVNDLAVDAIENGRERIAHEAIESWEPEFDAKAAFE